jgi:hypothetical protein
VSDNRINILPGQLKAPLSINLNLDLSKSMPHLFPPKNADMIHHLPYRAMPVDPSNQYNSFFGFTLRTHEYATISYLWFLYNAGLGYGVFVNSQQLPKVGNMEEGQPSSGDVLSYGYGRGQTVGADYTNVDDILNGYIFLKPLNKFEILVKNNTGGITMARAYVKGWKYLDVN